MVHILPGRPKGQQDQMSPLRATIHTSMSFRWLVQELPSSEGLDLYPATDAPTLRDPRLRTRL